ncbi:carboxylating nicotinate-nucleotide diphosphorylase [bacterium]|nr:carboxylating nicotinate-nucleotide diphosphorylase [bacterium]MBU1065164.1 carboxylating nicotinate-nucleotide diphosphorylase [bacterium]MBU1635864.1 carboxylating nicotinate-nucleotide diphosphorylase [bacterium]MBU1873485.1 carboxylating nicotinate-nucleotide diphosphorylase [bacterium]
MDQINRDNVIRNAFDAADELDLSRSSYRDTVNSFLKKMIDEDVDSGDVSLIPRQSYESALKAKIIAKSPAVIAGLDETIYFASRHDLQIQSDFKNGDLVKSGDILLRVTGKAAEILTLERSILNILQRLSGIATTTKSYVDTIAGTNTFIVGTRKTLWGLLDKHAIQCGGGLTHRLGLHDAAMLKENHLAVLRNSDNPDALRNAVTQMISAYPYLRFIEIEVSNADEFRAILGYLKNITAPFPFVIMFDHFEPDQIHTLINEAKSKKLYNHILFEASGNITLDTIRSFAESGVDVISVGALTHSVTSADFSLLIESN